MTTMTSSYYTNGLSSICLSERGLNCFLPGGVNDMCIITISPYHGSLCVPLLRKKGEIRARDFCNGTVSCFLFNKMSIINLLYDG